MDIKRNATFQKIDLFLEEHAQEMAQDMLRLIRIDSARGPEQPDMPYGEGPATALALGGELMRQYGLRVEHFQNRVVTGDATEQERHLDILAHLDVVPGGQDWTVCQPFEPVIRDGVLYGRGASDDKGPAVAALYAIRAVRETGVPLERNVRLILGSDEECGSSDIAAYYQMEPEAPMTFSPDANWPVVNTEKGRLKCGFSSGWERVAQGPALLEGYSGEKENVVPGTAYARVRGLSAEVITSVLHSLQVAPADGGLSDVRVTLLEEEIAVSAGVEAIDPIVRVEVKGVPCHAAHPQNGANALTALLRLLAALPLPVSPAMEAVTTLARLMPHGQTDGTEVGIRAMDALSGDLTLAFSIFRLSETGLTGIMDCRVPICADEAFLRKGLEATFGPTCLKIMDWTYSPPHHVPADSPFIQTLLSCYTEVTGKTGDPIAIGGGTYVHSLKNGVAYGCELQGEDRRMHGPDEFAVLAELLESARIFARVIVRLCGPQAGSEPG